MKNLKNIILTFILMFICIKGISAADVASINGTKYTTISDALTAATEGQEITLLSDVESIIVNKGKKVIINLNEYKVETIENSGNLTLVGNGTINPKSLANGIVNNENASLIIKNAKLETESSGWSIKNSGDMTIEYLNIIYNEELEKWPKHINNESSGSLTIHDGSFKGSQAFINSGKMTIYGGTFETIHSLYSNENEGTLLIKGGTFSSIATAIGNKSNELTIDGGIFNVESVASNEAEENSQAIINVNNGTFKTTGCAFSNGLTSENSTLNINGGKITSTTDMSVICEYSGASTNTINIRGGEIDAPESSGIHASGEARFVIGINDGNVNTSSPLIKIPKGRLAGLGVPTYEIYDGKIILDEKIDLAIYGLNTPQGYYLQYDSNNDSTYTAYLKTNFSDNKNIDDNNNDNYDVTSLWEKYVEKYKITDIIKTYTDSSISVDIKSTETTLNSIIDDGTIKLVGNFNHDNGVVSYVPLNDKEVSFETIFNEDVIIENAIVALANLKGYDSKKLKTWLYENEGKLSLEKDGIEYTLEDYTKQQDNGVTLTVKKVKSFKFKLDSDIKFDSKKVENPKTGINLDYKVLLGIIVIGIGAYLYTRKKSKFPKHN